MSTTILRVGMVTPVGLSAQATAAALRAGVSRISETPFFDHGGDPIAMGQLPAAFWQASEDFSVLSDDLDEDERVLRAVALAAAALRDCLGEDSALRQVPLFLAAPEPLFGQTADSGERICKRLSEFLPGLCDDAASRSFPAGRAGGMLALQAALEWLSAHPEQQVLIGGADTFFDAELLETLDSESRIHGKTLGDGLLPGEGAAFLLLGAAQTSAVAEIVAVGVGREPGHRYSPEPCRGDGLSAAVRQLFTGAGSAIRDIHTIYASLNGESLQAYEWGIAALRSRSHLAADFRVHHPADCIGDVGAASAPLLLGLAALGIERGYRPAPALIWCASDLDCRGAALVSRA